MIKTLKSKLGIELKDKNLLERALTHRSYLNEHQSKSLRSNERLEFLGDAVLELWTTEQLFHHFPDLPEGVLTNIRAALVRTESLAKIAQRLNLGKYLKLSRGEDAGGGRENVSLLADTFEAVLGAIYLDQGKKGAVLFLEKYLLKDLLALGKNGDIKDAKTKLQETIQAKLKTTPHYEIVKEEGPDHEKTFTAAVFFNEKKVTQGVGSSKREAEEKAAEKALESLKKTRKV